MTNITPEGLAERGAPELLPCPFCGGQAEYKLAWGVKCRTCGAGIPCRGDEFGPWNRRATPSALDGDALAKLIAEARAEGMERAAGIADSCADQPGAASYIAERILAEAATIRKGETGC